MTESDEETCEMQNPTQLPALRSVRSDEILQGNKEVRILHEGEVYRLLVTRNGKLILQK